MQGQLAAIGAQISGARLNLQYTKIRAPFSSRIGLSSLNEGELASPGGEALTTLVDLDPIEVRFETREDELPRIREARLGEGPPRMVALLGNDAAYAEYGALGALDTSTGTMTALAEFPNPNELLLPGRFFDVRLLLGRTEAILIPAAGLSSTTISRLKAAWWEEYERWQRRDFGTRRIVYLWAVANGARTSGAHIGDRLRAWLRKSNVSWS